jgi:hypothetical protein
MDQPPFETGNTKVTFPVHFFDFLSLVNSALLAPHLFANTERGGFSYGQSLRGVISLHMLYIQWVA